MRYINQYTLSGEQYDYFTLFKKYLSTYSVAKIVLRPLINKSAAASDLVVLLIGISL